MLKNEGRNDIASDIIMSIFVIICDRDLTTDISCVLNKAFSNFIIVVAIDCHDYIGKV